MKINLLHLYPDLMNLYGEYANVELLKRHLSDQGFEAEITRADSVCDIELSEVHFVYVGAGMERSQRYALEDIMKKRDELCDFSGNGGVMLFTGSAYELLGKTITDENGTEREALGIGDYLSVQRGERRITGDCYASCVFLDKAIVGFMNKCSCVMGNNDSIFNMEMGFGDNEGNEKEGFRRNNTFGTYLIGPLLVKNPHMMEYFVKCIGRSADESFEYKDIEYPYEQKAYEVTERKLRERMERGGL